MTEINYETIDAGVRKLVKMLNDHGFTTTDSGDGTKVRMECAVDFPMVVIRIKDEERDRLISEADRLKKILSFYHDIKFEAMGGGGPSIEASYDPTNGVALIVLCNVKDDMLRDS